MPNKQGHIHFTKINIVQLDQGRCYLAQNYLVGSSKKTNKFFLDSPLI